MRGVKNSGSLVGIGLLVTLYLALPGLSYAATKTLTSNTSVSGEVKNIDCLGNSINNPSEIIYPYPVVCETTVNGAVLVEPNLSFDEQLTPDLPSASSNIQSKGPFGAVLNVVGIEGTVNTVAVMTVVGLTALVGVFVVLRAMGLVSTRGISRFLLRRPRLK